MKTTLIVVLALLGLAAARSLDEKSLLTELKDLLKRRPGSGGPPRRPMITCNTGVKFRDVIERCTGFELDEDDLEDDDDDDRRRSPKDGPRFSPYCHLQMALGADAVAVAQCIQTDCPSFQVDTNCPLSCDGGDAFFDVVGDCLAPYANSIDEDALEGEKPYCNLVQQLGKDNADEIAKCIQRQCTIPDEYKYENIQCPARRQMGSCGKSDVVACAQQAGIQLPRGGGREERILAVRGRGEDRFCKGVELFGADKAESMSQCLNTACGAPLMSASSCTKRRMRPDGVSPELMSCLKENMGQCAQQAGVTLPWADKRKMGKIDPFCGAVYKFGATKAETLNNCLVTACQVPVRSADECPEQETISCVLQNLRSCSSAAGLSGPQRPARGLGDDALEHFCKAVDKFGADAAEQVSSCLAGACNVQARTASECQEDDLKRKLMKLLDIQ